MSGSRYAILIGSSEFPDEPKLKPLRCPLNDVDGLREVLESPEYGGFSEVATFKNRPHNEINLKLNEILNRAAKDDFVLIYYSGHGKLDRSGRLHLTTSDTRLDVLGATSIPWPRVVDYLRDAYTTRVAVLLDCCYGGAAGASFRSAVEDQLQQATQARGTYVMTAATSTELARENEQDDYGLFTKHVIEGIKTGDADLDGDGQISMDDLYRYVQEHLREEGGQQPTMTGIDVRGELYIAKSRHSRRDERLTKLRKRLYSLAAKEVVADELVKSAIEIAAMKPGEMSEAQRRLDSLLDAYLAGKLKVGELARQWYQSASTVAEIDPPETESRNPPFDLTEPAEPGALPTSSGPAFDLEPVSAGAQPSPPPVLPPDLPPAAKIEPRGAAVTAPTYPRKKKLSAWLIILPALVFVGALINELRKLPKDTVIPRDSAPSTSGGGTGAVTTGGGSGTPTAADSAKLDDEIMAAEKAGKFEDAAHLCHKGHTEFPSMYLKYKVREFENVVEFDKDAAVTIGDGLYKGEAHDNYKALNSMAWAIVRDRFNVITDRDLLDLALDCAARANDLSDDRDPYTLDTLAYTIYRIDGKLDVALMKSDKAILLASANPDFSETELSAMRTRRDRIRARMGSSGGTFPGG